MEEGCSLLLASKSRGTEMEGSCPLLASKSRDTEKVFRPPWLKIEANGGGGDALFLGSKSRGSEVEGTASSWHRIQGERMNRIK